MAVNDPTFTPWHPPRTGGEYVLPSRKRVDKPAEEAPPAPPAPPEEPKKGRG